MADRSNYADKLSIDSGAIPEHRLGFNNDARGFTPNAGETDNEGSYGNLAANSVGDNNFKSARYYANDSGWIWSREMIDATYPNGYVPNVRIVEPESRRAQLEAQMPTFTGVPPSAAELYGRNSYSPA